MTWGTEPITEPGWYWFKSEYREKFPRLALDPFVVSRHWKTGELVVHSCDNSYSASLDAHCEGYKAWCPIPEPQEPQEADYA